jgi:hypothetical protein
MDREEKRAFAIGVALSVVLMVVQAWWAWDRIADKIQQQEVRR